MMFPRDYCYLSLLFSAILLAACTEAVTKWDPDDYTVKSGDTVYSIAWRYELDPEDIVAWNRLDSSMKIMPGQRLHTRKPDNYVAPQKTDDSYAGKIAYTPKAPSRKSSPVEKKTSPPAADLKWIKVQKGDTLYGISSRYGVSVKQLAQLNQLQKPYVIQPGQTLFLKPLKSSATVAKQSTGTRKAVAGSRQTKGGTKKSATATPAWPSTVRWQRPAKGKIVKKFNRRQNDAKGIDIAGRVGETIVASADGKVVYSGEGLISYGKLIIIKHNKAYLSAYAYNHKLLVKEGERVRAGQKIAEMGKKDKLGPRLHFEIRKNGKPVDPLKYLPG